MPGLPDWSGLATSIRQACDAMEPADQTDTDLLFDKRWALDLLDRAMKRLRAEFAAKNLPGGSA